MPSTVAIFVLAACARIGLLALFVWLLIFTQTDFTGRAYAAYGGIYILSSLLWLRLAEGQQPSRSDLAGMGLAVLGTLIILAGGMLAER